MKNHPPYTEDDWQVDYAAGAKLTGRPRIDAGTLTTGAFSPDYRRPVNASIAVGT